MLRVVCRGSMDGKKSNIVDAILRGGCKTEALDFAFVLNAQRATPVLRPQLHDESAEHAGLFFGVAMLLEVTTLLIAQHLVQARLNTKLNSIQPQCAASGGDYLRQGVRGPTCAGSHIGCIELPSGANRQVNACQMAPAP